MMIVAVAVTMIVVAVVAVTMIVVVVAVLASRIANEMPSQ